MSPVGIGRTPGEDPAVLSWRIALAPRPRYSTNGRHWWRDLVTETYRAARDARDAMRESCVAASGQVAGTAHSLAGYSQLSDEEFAQAVPQVTLRHVLEGLSQGSQAPPW